MPPFYVHGVPEPGTQLFSGSGGGVPESGTKPGQNATTHQPGKEGLPVGLSDFIDNMRVPEVRRDLWNDFVRIHRELVEDLCDIAHGREPRHQGTGTVALEDAGLEYLAGDEDFVGEAYFEDNEEEDDAEEDALCEDEQDEKEDEGEEDEQEDEQEDSED
jgi:hypothetical protein